MTVMCQPNNIQNSTNSWCTIFKIVGGVGNGLDLFAYENFQDVRRCGLHNYRMDN